MDKINPKHELTMQIAAATSFGLALSSLFFAYAYSQDISAIVASPAQLWAFVCGVPIQSTATIPILVGLAIMATGIGSTFVYLRHRLLHASKHAPIRRVID